METVYEQSVRVGREKDEEWDEEEEKEEGIIRCGGWRGWRERDRGGGWG